MWLHVASCGARVTESDPCSLQVSYTKHVNHSENDTHAQKERQSDPLASDPVRFSPFQLVVLRHSHAVILDP